jgi:predicted ribosome-associated RNA-binding protein Tma20
VRARYAPHSARQTAHDLLSNPDVRELVAKYEQEAAERLAVTRERMLEELQAAIEVARLKGDPMAMIAGWREIAKMCGYYAPERKKVEISVDGAALQAKMAAMSDEELLAIADGREASA